MTLTYIFHSGFVLETEKSILIFDYWLDLNGVVPPFLKKDKQFADSAGCFFFWPCATFFS